MDENHRRALASGLNLVERQLEKVNEVITQQSGDRPSHPIEDDLNPATKHEMARLARQMSEEVAKTREEFDIKPRKDSARALVVASLTEIWLVLEDLRPRKMEAFGPISEHDKRKLQPHIEKILEELDDLFSLVDKDYARRYHIG
ncbi:MAG: hypothetical protein QW057_10075 [Candidatus Bathyarchaeia archaeon]